MTGPRIVSLLPSTTEIVYHLGLLPHLVGRSHECDFPPEVEALPAVTSARIDPAAPSASIDRDVRSLVERVLSVFEVDAEALKALRPDVILTQHRCAVCAVSEKDLGRALAEWTGAAPLILSSAPARLRDLYADIERIAVALDRRYEGEALAQSMRERAEVIAERAGGVSPRPKVVVLDWLDPPMSAGLWVPELVRAAGGRPLLAKVGVEAPRIEAADIAAGKPDVLVLAPCGFDLARTEREAEAFLARPEIAGLDARVAAVDGNAYLNRPGPRLVDSLEILAEILAPAAFNFRHEDRGWRALR